MAVKGLSTKEAIKQWEEANKQSAAEALDIQLQFQWPPIEKMDNTLSSLVKCEKLSLSTNMIEKISGVNGMKNLKILSLARNNIKSLVGLELLGDTLEQLWISYNIIEKLKGIESMKNLSVLYIGNNLIKDWQELAKLGLLPKLVDLLLNGNPACESVDETWYRNQVGSKCKVLKVLDGIPVVREENE